MVSSEDLEPPLFAMRLQVHPPHELVAGEETSPEIMEFFTDFGRFRLGKGIVYGKDTPNFIANRIGVFGVMATIHAMFSSSDKITRRVKTTPDGAEAVIGFVLSPDGQAILAAAGFETP